MATLIAAEDGDIQELSRLMDAGIDINHGNSDGDTPLKIATIIGRLDVVEFILKSRGDSDVMDCNGNTPLMFTSDPQIARKLIDYGANVNLTNKHGWTPLMIAEYLGNIEMIRILSFD